jgi:hypothetical protein
MYLRLRLAQRLRLLGPLVRLERRVETWATGVPARPRATFDPTPNPRRA